MKIGITGAAGFIGRALAERARRAGHEVTGLDRAGGGFATHVGDINDLDLLHRFCRGLDRVYHTAAIVQESGAWADFFRINVLGADSVALVAREHGVREIVHLSSVMVHGFDFPEGVTEDGPLDPADNPYCATKILSEEALLRHHDPGRFDVYLIRPGDVYGPGSVPWTLRPLAMMKRGRWIHADGDHAILNHVYVDNLLDGIELVLARRASGTPFIITDGVRTTTRAFFGHYERMLGLRPSPNIPRALALPLGALAGRALAALGRPAEVNREAVRYMLRRACYGTGKIRALGFEPAIDLAEGMARTQRWLEREGLLPAPSA
jgi:nucleoside-diphosphate-sugar epimerase